VFASELPSVSDTYIPAQLRDAAGLEGRGVGKSFHLFTATATGTQCERHVCAWEVREIPSFLPGRGPAAEATKHRGRDIACCWDNSVVPFDRCCGWQLVCRLVVATALKVRVTSTEQHCIALHCTSLHCIAPRDSPLRHREAREPQPARFCFARFCIASHRIALRCHHHGWVGCLRCGSVAAGPATCRQPPRRFPFRRSVPGGPVEYVWVCWCVRV
jgi:hypothetical protein